MKLTQPQLARVLGGDRPLSVPLISSWESQSAPKIPPIHRLEAYATFFATRRSVDTGEPQLLSTAEMTDTELRAKEDLTRELMHLRSGALRATNAPEVHEIPESLNASPWRFDDGEVITIVCAQLPEEMRQKMPYTDPADPNYTDLYRYTDLDALFELYAHVHASNPTSHVNLRIAGELKSDDYTAHLVSLGGVDWNVQTVDLLGRLQRDFQMPVWQVADWKSSEGPYFEVKKDDGKPHYRPRLEQSGEHRILKEDVALFVRARNPHNRKRTVTLCNGMYSRGTYGAVRALTDARFRDRNTEYVRDRFAGEEAFCIVTRVAVENNVAVTPDWTLPESRLFEWPGLPAC